MYFTHFTFILVDSTVCTYVYKDNYCVVLPMWTNLTASYITYVQQN